MEYIAFELLSPENAAGQLDRLEQGMLKVETFPEKFRAYALLYLLRLKEENKE